MFSYKAVWNIVCHLCAFSPCQDEGVAEAEYQETLKEKVRTLEAYMVEIAQTVIKDAEQTGGEAEAKAPSAFR